jgi:hypothetical protein
LVNFYIAFIIVDIVDVVVVVVVVVAAAASVITAVFETFVGNKNMYRKIYKHYICTLLTFCSIAPIGRISPQLVIT